MAVRKASKGGRGASGLRAVIFGSTASAVVREQIVGERVPAKKAVDALRGALALTIEDMASALAISPRTIERHIAQGKPLAAAQADRAYRLARIVDLAVELIGDAGKARAWLETPHRALGGEAPLALIATDAGTQLVEASLYTIAYGGVA